MASVPRRSDGRPASLVVIVELEELPRLHLVADFWEDEQRLRCWLAHPAARRRLADTLLAALEKAA
jgi:hypothetical protein